MRSPAWYTCDGRCPWCDQFVDEFFSRGRCFACFLDLIESAGVGLDPDLERLYVDIGGES